MSIIPNSAASFLYGVTDTIKLEALYDQAEKRGSRDGDETLDWLEAEKDVDSLLGEAANSVSG
ncbi:DUF2934 domain-containing protein [Gammaproteobacteria bacterium]|nr:DUF2934 domain-containing protein [Gammaproteobacteria bacterium]